MPLPPPINAPKTNAVSGLAIASLIFGIVGILFGFFLIIPPVIAIILGHLARASCRKHTLDGSGIALSGLILGYLGLLPMTLMAVSVISHFDRAKANAPREAIVTAPEYMTLIGEGFSGSGFHFSIDDQRYIACSLHQFDGATPEVMHAGLMDSTIQITDLVTTQEDLQILRYTGDGLDQVPPLPYEYQPELKLGTPIYLYDFEESYSGHITRRERGSNNYSIRMTAPFPAGGSSGSPVVSAETGKVIGVVLTANSADAATTVGFEALSWDPSQTDAP